jgi:hypothetical protein
MGSSTYILSGARSYAVAGARMAGAENGYLGLEAPRRRHDAHRQIGPSQVEKI